MTEVFVAELGQLAARAKRDLRAAGIIVVEVKALTRCKFLRASETFSGDDLLWAALVALNHKGSYGSHGTEQRELFVRNLTTIIQATRKDAK